MKIFFAGLGLGVIAGLLLAPKRGRETRADLGGRARRMISAASDVIARRARGHGGSLSTKKSPASAAISRTGEERDGIAEALNIATRDQLIALQGIGQVLADRIIENRPYQKAYEVVEKGIVPESTFLQLRRELLDKSA